nr:DUF2059 domain-containing protein [Sphingomicrobium nitratireducens]
MVRDGLARAFAGRFTDAELKSIATFAKTPAGKKFASEIWKVGFAPEYFGGMMKAMPTLVKGIKPMGETLEARMAHLPPMFPEPEPDCVSEEDAAEMADDEDAAEVEICVDEVEEEEVVEDDA